MATSRASASELTFRVRTWRTPCRRDVCGVGRSSGRMVFDRPQGGRDRVRGGGRSGFAPQPECSASVVTGRSRCTARRPCTRGGRAAASSPLHSAQEALDRRQVGRVPGRSPSVAIACSDTRPRMRPAVICGPLAREEPRASSELVAGPRVRDRGVTPAPHPGALSRALTPGRAGTPPTRRRLHGVGARAARNSAVTGQDASPVRNTVPAFDRPISPAPSRTGHAASTALGSSRARLFILSCRAAEVSTSARSRGCSSSPAPGDRSTSTSTTF
jgi:hypothetical protein